MYTLCQHRLMRTKKDEPRPALFTGNNVVQAEEERKPDLPQHHLSTVWFIRQVGYSLGTRPPKVILDTEAFLQSP